VRKFRYNLVLCLAVSFLVSLLFTAFAAADDYSISINLHSASGGTATLSGVTKIFYDRCYEDYCDTQENYTLEADYFETSAYLEGVGLITGFISGRFSYSSSYIYGEDDEYQGNESLIGSGVLTLGGQDYSIELNVHYHDCDECWDNFYSGYIKLNGVAYSINDDLGEFLENFFLAAPIDLKGTANYGFSETIEAPNGGRAAGTGSISAWYDPEEQKVSYTTEIDINYTDFKVRLYAGSGFVPISLEGNYHITSREDYNFNDDSYYEDTKITGSGYIITSDGTRIPFAIDFLYQDSSEWDEESYSGYIRLADSQYPITEDLADILWELFWY